LKESSIESDLNYESRTIDAHDEHGFIVRKPLKDYITKETYEFIQNQSKIQSKPDREKVEKYVKKYSLNIRGLLLYILSEVPSSLRDPQNNTEKYRKKNTEKYRKKISEVLEHLSEYYPSTFPFLLHYNSFREIFKNMTKNKYSGYFEVEILIDVALELKTQIQFDEQYSNSNWDSNNNAMINYWIMKRYSSEVTYYFTYLLTYLKDDNKEFIRLFREYQKNTITMMSNYLKDEQKSVQDLLDDYNKKTLLISSK
jgi:hypothetical protein